jgi:phage baseplate assembly protein W
VTAGDPTTVEVARRYFGTGIRLTSVAPDSIGVDVVLEPGPHGTDLASVSGIANLAQDLQVALLTPTGSDPFNVVFGFDGLRVLSDDMSPPMTTEMLRLAVLKTVSLDNRVRRVLDVRMEETEPGSRRWSVEVELQTVLGELVRFVVGDVNGR